MAQAGSYKINVNNVNKTVDMLIEGTFTPKQVQEFVADYTAKVKAINPKQFALKVDSTDMDLLSQEMIPSMKNSISMYKQTGFEKLTITIKKNPVLKMQLNRIVRECDFANAEIVEI